MLHLRVYAVGCLPGAGNVNPGPKGRGTKQPSSPHSLPAPASPRRSPAARSGVGILRAGDRGISGIHWEADRRCREGVPSFGRAEGTGSESCPTADPLRDLGQPLLLTRGQEAGS